MKNHNRRITATCLLLLLASTSYATETDASKSDKAADPETTVTNTPKTTNTQAFIPQGHLSVMQNETVFFPCNTLEEYKVEDQTKTHMLSYLYEGFSADATYPIYLEIETGKLTEKAGEKHLIIKKIKQASSVEEKLECRSIGFNPNFRAMGAEPFWHLIVLPAGLLLLDEQGQATRYPYVEPKVKAEHIHYTLKQQDQSLAIKFEKKTCMPSNDDAETPTKFAYTASIDIGDKTFQGCAIKGKTIEKIKPTS